MKQTISLVPKPKKLALQTRKCCASKITHRSVNETLQEEGYVLSISREKIVAEAATDAGFFYAEKTLEQLLFQFPGGIPCMEIDDAPSYPHRSFHMDVARHFLPMEELKRMVNAAASFKFNRLHWHFSDDQGWRIESRVFPLLHEVGAKRKGDHFGRMNSDVEEHHYYTQDEVRDFVDYCRARHVEVIPEVDIPGHVTAILAAYPQLSCQGKPLAVATCAGIFPDILCPGKEETFAFLEVLLDELCELFPGRYFHIGGDETPKTHWNTCPHCQKRMAQENLSDTRQLQGYMTNRIAAHLRKKGKRAIVWNEAALGDNLDTNIIVQLWNDDPKDPSLKSLSKEKDENGRPTSPNQGIGSRLIRKGHDVYLSPMRSSYCDYPIAYIAMKGVHTGDLVPQKCEDIPELAKKHILGGESLCWAEYIRDVETLERLAWLRYAAKAERLWLGDQTESYKAFVKRLKGLYPYMKALLPGINPPKKWIPGPVQSAREMLAFASLFTGAIREGYADAQSEV